MTSNRFSIVFSNCLKKPTFFYETSYKKTGKRSVKSNLDVKIDKKDTIMSPTVFAEMFNKNYVDFATSVESQSTKELKKSLIKINDIDDTMFASPTIMIEVSNTVGNSKNNKNIGFDSVSTEVLKFVFFSTEYNTLFLSRSWFLKCPNDAKVYPLHKSGNKVNINNYRLISIKQAVSKVFKNSMYD